MYIALKTINGRKSYFIRESYRHGNIYLFRDLAELGSLPQDHIIYPGGRSFYIDDALYEQLIKKGVSPDPHEVDELFWPYVRMDIKRKYEFSQSRGANRSHKKVDAGDIHHFDLKRLLYLRTGQMNQGAIYKTPSKILIDVHEKSRDEIEQYFMLNEKALPPEEIKTYTYVIFDIHRHFSKPFARYAPHALDQTEVSRHFEEDICNLNRDGKFWAGMEMDHFLQDYLKRYVIMFHDNPYPESRYLEDLLKSRINRQRYARTPSAQKNSIFKDAAEVFDVEEKTLKKMTRSQLRRLYRKKARHMHPDKGGEHENFIRLSQVYEELLSTIS